MASVRLKKEHKMMMMQHYYLPIGAIKYSDAMAIKRAISEFIGNGMLVEVADGMLKITDKGRAYVDKLRSVPLPEKKVTWVFPDDEDDEN